MQYAITESHIYLCVLQSMPPIVGGRDGGTEEMKDKMLLAAGIVVVAVLSFAAGLYVQRERIINNAIVTYEERNSTAWVYMSIDGNVHAYDPETGQKEE